MKTTGILLFIIFSFVSRQTIAQTAQEIGTEKVQFFTEKLGLTLQESEKFWPVFNDYQNRKEKILQDRKNTMMYFHQNYQNMSKAELKDISEKLIESRKKETELFEKYHAKFLQILPMEKAIMVQVAEMQFKNQLLQRLGRHRMRNRGGRNFTP